MSTDTIAVPTVKSSALYFAGLILTAVAATLYLSASIVLPAYIPINSVARFWLLIPFTIPWAPFMASACYFLFGIGLLSGRVAPPSVSLLGIYTMMEGMFLIFSRTGTPLRNHAVPIFIELVLLGVCWLLWWWARRSPSFLNRTIFTACFSVFFSCAMLGWQATPYVQRGL